jgi:hypothetical protein
MTVGHQAGADGSLTSVGVKNLTVAALAPALSADDGGPFLQTSLAIEATVRADAGGTFSGVDGTLSTADGLLSVSGKDRIELTGAALGFALDRGSDRLAIPRAEIRTRTGGAAFEGSADLSGVGRTELIAQLLDASLPTLPGQAAVPLTGGEALLRFDHSERTLHIERFQLAAADGSAQ